MMRKEWLDLYLQMNSVLQGMTDFEMEMMMTMQRKKRVAKVMKRRRKTWMRKKKNVSGIFSKKMNDDEVHSRLDHPKRPGIRLRRTSRIT